MKKKFRNLTLAVTLTGIALFSATAFAANINDIIKPVINSTTITNDLVLSNGVYVAISSGTSKGYSGFWTNQIVNVPYTNVTLVASSTTAKDLSGQFNFSLNATNPYVVQGVWTLARNNSGTWNPQNLTITNANGSPMLLDLFMQITNTVAVNTTASDTSIFNLGTTPLVAAGASKINILDSAFDGGVANFYVYSFTLYTNGIAAGPTATLVGTNLYGWVNPL